jgi:ABC-type bacteriocin/lantibiotic exporter with double-glycine peptidase domain
MKIFQLRILENLKQKIFTRASFEFAFKIPRFKYDLIRNKYLPEHINRFFDVITLQKVLPKILIDFTVAIVQLLFGLILLSFYHPFFILYDVLMLIFIYLIYRYFAQKGLEENLLVSKYKYKMAYWLQELGRVYLAFKYASNSNFNLINTNEINKKYIKSREKYFNTLLIQYSFFLLFNVITIIGLLAVGGYLVINQKMNIGQFVAAEIIIILLLNSVEKIIFTLESAFDLFTSLEKISTVTDISLDKDTGINLNDAEAIKIEYHKLFYKYPNTVNFQLHDINTTIHPKQIVGIYGSKNSGKTTFVNILSGLLTPTQGDILYNNFSIKELNPESLHKLIGYCSAENLLFEGTILDNITLGRENIKIEDVNTVIYKLNLSEYIENCKEGLQTIIKPNINEIPYNIIVKILLARATVIKPRLLIIDEIFDHIVPEDIHEIIEFLTNRDNPWTLVLVSKSTKMLSKTDKIIWLEKGEIKGEYKYKELEKYIA